MSEEFKTETRYFLPCCNPKSISDFMYLGGTKKGIGICKNCNKDNCKVSGKPIRATITYKIEVEK